MKKVSVLEKLQSANQSAEIWWDSSPLAFPSWSENILKNAPTETKRSEWSCQLDRFLVDNKPETSFVRGITTNPTLIAKTIIETPEIWASKIRDIIKSQSQPDVESSFWLIYQEAIRETAQIMLPMWHATNGQYGWISGQLDPRHVFDTDRMMEQALQIARISPNIMIKVPGTRQGYEVVRRLVTRGISINSTLSYTLPQFMACIDAIEGGLAEARRQGVDVTRFSAVITYMIGRFGSQGDLLDEAKARGISLSLTEIRWAEVAILKRIHSIIRSNGYQTKMLISSLQVDDPDGGATSLSMHLEQTAGGNIAYTCKPQFIADLMLREDEIDAFDETAIDREIPAEVMEKLIRIPYFLKAYETNGMMPDEFANHGAFLTTHAEANRSIRRLIDFITIQFQDLTELRHKQMNRPVSSQMALATEIFQGA